jgi:hypothetical protein
MNLTRRPRDGMLVLRDPRGGGGVPQRSFGLIMVLGGGFALQHLARTGGWATCIDLCGVGFAAVVTLLGLFALAHFDDVRLDLVKRTYLRRSGLWPFHSCRRGSFDEIEAIRVRFETRPLGPRSEGGGGTVQVTVVTLHWKEQIPRPLRISEQEKLDALWSNRADGFADADWISRLIGIPVVDSRFRS